MSELIDKITEAFQGVCIPKQDEISIKDDWESGFITKHFGKYIDENENENEIVILQNYKSIPALNPIAFLFFLPTYLRYAIQNPDSEVAEYLIQHFSSNIDSKYWKERYRFIDKKQRMVICDAIKYLRFKGEISLIDDLAEKALNNWCKD